MRLIFRGNFLPFNFEFFLQSFSVKEAVCARVPLLALPLFAEQPYTADSVVKQKIGRVLHKKHVTGEQMLEQVKEVKIVFTFPLNMLFSC